EPCFRISDDVNIAGAAPTRRPEYCPLQSTLSSLLRGEASLPMMSDNDLAKVFTRFVVTEGADNVAEREHSIDDRLQPVHGDGPVHGDELGPTAREDDAECCNGVIEFVDIDR